MGVLAVGHLAVGLVAVLGVLGVPRRVGDGGGGRRGRRRCGREDFCSNIHEITTTKKSARVVRFNVSQLMTNCMLATLELFQGQHWGNSC